jgi:hypothetical protein
MCTPYRDGRLTLPDPAPEFPRTSLRSIAVTWNPDDPAGSADEPVLFLDVDGVLNNLPHIWSIHAPCKPKWRELLPEKVLLLEEIVRRTGAAVVVSSSWGRRRGGLERVQDCLAHHGFTGAVVDTAPYSSLPGNHRADEVRAWREEVGHRGRFVVLDDEFPCGEPDLEPFVVRPDPMVGLLPEHMEEAVRILGGA